MTCRAFSSATAAPRRSKTAIKFARCATGRQDIVYCDHAFHGLTTGSLSLNGADFFRERFGELMPGTQMIPFNDLAALGAGAGRARGRGVHRRAGAGQDLRSRRGRISGRGAAAVPKVRHAAGRRRSADAGWAEPANGLLSALARASSRTSSARPRRCRADTCRSARSITRPQIMDCVFNSMERCVVHSNTFGQNDLAMAAALASLYVIEEDKLVENAAAMGDYVDDAAARDRQDLPVRLRRPRQGPDVRHRLRPARRNRSS